MSIQYPDQDIPDTELLARFILFSDWIRNDQTVRPNAFMPHPKHLDVSVTRHDRSSEREIWKFGELIAAHAEKTLHGRADISAASVKLSSLSLRPDPTPDNPSHACIVGWFNDKAAQKSIAQQLAAASTFCKK